MGSIYEGSKFTWEEATKNWQRNPSTVQQKNNIIKLARYMDDVRELLGNRPIIPTSWYRDPLTNKRVGGVSNSIHLTGLAIDFVVVGMDARTVQAKLENFHGDRGGLGKYSNFTHLDLRGYRARW